MVLVDLGLIDGNSFSAASVDALEAAINASCDAGDIKMTIRAVTAPTGWIFLAGQVVINFQGLYPQAWLVIPASWKSGSNANIPNMAQSFPIGQDGTHALGAAGGANTHVLLSGNLPPHAHAIDHDHGVVTSTAQSVNHNHGISGPLNGFDQFVVQNISPPGPHAVFDAGDTSTGATIFGAAGLVSSSEQDPTTHAASAHTHNVDLPNYVGASDNGPGASTAVDHTPKWVAFNFIMKVH